MATLEDQVIDLGKKLDTVIISFNSMAATLSNLADAVAKLSAPAAPVVDFAPVIAAINGVQASVDAIQAQFAATPGNVVDSGNTGFGITPPPAQPAPDAPAAAKDEQTSS